MDNQPTSEIRIPLVSANDAQVRVVRWLVTDGQLVFPGQPLVEIESSKATYEIECDARGYVLSRLLVGETATVGALLAQIFPTLDSYTTAQRSKPRGTSTGETNAVRSRLSRAARDYAEANSLSIVALEGCGLVTRKRLESLAGSCSADERFQSTAERLPPKEASMLQDSEFHTAVSLSAQKRREIDLLSLGQAGALRSSLTVHFDSTLLRRRLREHDLFGGQPLALILAQTAALLKQQPKFACFYHRERLWCYDAIDIALALDLGQGLLAPVVRSVDKLTPEQIHTKIGELIRLYKNKKLHAGHLERPAFTVSDLSGMGIDFFEPMLGPRQSAVLGIGGNPSLSSYPMTFTLAFDHRALSGMEAASFLKSLRSRVLEYHPSAPDRRNPSKVPTREARAGPLRDIRETDLPVPASSSEKEIAALVAEVCSVATAEAIKGVRAYSPWWDSMHHFALVSELEDRFGVRLTVQEIDRITTVKDLVALLGELRRQ